jgi:hypothetical protein
MNGEDEDQWSAEDPDVMPPPSQEWQDAHGWKDGKPPPNGKGQDEHINYTANRVFIRHTTLRDEADIPKRPWIAPGYLLRGAVTLLFGPPDQGKSLLLIAWTVALGLKRRWGSFNPKTAVKVLVILAEEDDEEQNARFAAALRAFDATRTDLEPNLRRLVVPDLATLLEVDEATGKLKPTKGWDDLRHEIEDFHPDVVIADPLIEFHTAEENDNTKLKAVTGWFRSLARSFALAVVLCHHSRKGDQVPGSLEMARGASATGGAVRVAYTFLEATKDDVDRLGISPQNRRLFCRLDRARASQAPPTTDDAEWFEKYAYTLDNGDQTPALLPWEPPPAVAPGQLGLMRLLTDIAKGCIPDGSISGTGDPWSPQLRDTEPRSVRALFRRHGINRSAEDATMKALRDLGVHAAQFRAHRGYIRQGLRTTEQLPDAAWVQ